MIEISSRSGGKSYDFFKSFIGKHMGTPVVITTVEVQNRKHHKHRINKKWRKRYGITVYEKQEKGTILEWNGTLYMTKSDFEKIKDWSKIL